MKRVTAGSLFLAFTAVVMAASPPELINYQGVLRDASGTPADGSYDIVTRFWSDASGGDEILVDRHTTALSSPVAVNNGLFGIVLGSGSLVDGSGPGTYTSLSDVFRDYGDVYLGIQVGLDAEMVPRVPVRATPYSLNADRLDGLDSTAFLSAGADHWVDDTGDTMTGTLNLPANGLVAGTNQLVLSGGKVGIGTASPTELLDVAGSGDVGIRVNSTSGNAASLKLYQSGTLKAYLGVNSNDTYLDSGTGSRLHLRASGNPGQVVLHPSGNVGVGTASPSNKLSVAGNADITGSLGLGTSSVPANERLRILRGSGTFVTDPNALVQLSSSTNATNIWFNVTNDTGAPERNGTLGFAVAGEPRGGLTYNRFYDYIGIDHVDIGSGPGASPYPTDFAVKNGQVGVGTRSPGQKLDVVGGSVRTDEQFISTVPTGTPPFSVASSTKVLSLNADLLDGLSASSFATLSDLHTRYTDTEALSAMGSKADTNPLHHDRPTDAETAAATPMRDRIALRKWYDVSTVASFAVGTTPRGIVFDGNHVWIANRTSGTVTKIRASDGEILGNYAVGLEPLSLTFDGANIWVGNYADGTVMKLSAVDGSILDTINLGTRVDDVEFDGTNVWAAHGNIGGSVSKIRASDGTLLATYGSGGACAVGLEFDGTNLWIANWCASGIVAKMRPSDGAILGTTGVFTCNDMAFDGSSIWVSSGNNGQVVRLRASDGANLGTTTVGTGPVGVTFDGAHVWVANSGDNTVTKLRASDATVLGTFPTGSSPWNIAYDGANIWITNRTGNTVSKM